MEGKMKACFEKHPTAHTVFGIGIGLLLAGLIVGVASGTWVVLGIIVALGALTYDYFFIKVT